MARRLEGVVLPGPLTLGPPTTARLPLERVTLGLADGAAPVGTPLASAPARGERRPAAVLVALFEEEGDTRLVLTRRAVGLRRHAGEVCLPGGRMDVGEDAVTAALREAAEEVALDPGTVEVLGCLSPVVTRTSNSLVVPVLGALRHRPALTPSAAEVDRVFDVALSGLVVEGVPEAADPRTGAPAGHSSRLAWSFEAAGETVWGATARVLVDLLHRLGWRETAG